MNKPILFVTALSACAVSAPAEEKEEARGAAAANGATVAPAPAPAASPAAASGRGVEDPRAFVQSTYDAYRRGGTDTPPEWPVHAYSDRLKALFDAYDAWARQHDDLVGSLDFDWWVNAQDWELRGVELSQEEEGPDRRTIVARFDNAGRTDINRFRFVREGGRWYLDDVVNGHRDEEGWVLSELLRERPE
ncbi:MAG TPA: hypothetical protein VN231_04385 [Allosphingosinicella sp.]|nr:hypothetical protein [Allosphingosinicella sp.]